MNDYSDLTQAEESDDFGALLHRFRRVADLSQRALAAKVGVHSSYISRMERGEREPPDRKLVLKIIETLHLDERRGDELLLSAGYAPLSRTEGSPVVPELRLIADLFEDDRITESELGPLREYAKLLDSLRRQR